MAVLCFCSAFMSLSSPSSRKHLGAQILSIFLKYDRVLWCSLAPTLPPVRCEGARLSVEEVLMALG